MTGRELVFSNPEIARMAGTQFVPYAGDKWYLARQKDAEGAFMTRLGSQRFKDRKPENVVAQGIYVATADGALLGADHFHPDPERMVRMLRSSLERKETTKAEAPVRAEDTADPQYARTPPEGGLILKTFTRIPVESADGKWTPNDAVGRDHMWLTREEARALAPAKWERGHQYPVPRGVAERLIRFHLVDNVRGEPPLWERSEIRAQDLKLEVVDPATGRLRLLGTARMQTADDSRGYEARLQGDLRYDRTQARFSRWDALAWGEAWGEGPYTRNAPRGRFPLMVAFSLAGDAPADRVPPQGSRYLPGYLGTGQ